MEAYPQGLHFEKPPSSDKKHEDSFSFYQSSAIAMGQLQRFLVLMIINLILIDEVYLAYELA